MVLNNSKRFTITLISFIIISILAVLRHWFSGIDISIIGIGAGIITAYLTADTLRRSGKNGKKTQKR